MDHYQLKLVKNSRRRKRHYKNKLEIFTIEDLNMVSLVSTALILS